MKKIAIIDIGTNSMRLMISTLENDKVIASEKEVKTTRIGENMNKSKQIHPIAFERNLQALKTFKEKARREKTEEILVFGTSALRDATNGNVFIEQVKKRLGLTIQVLTGEEEAEIGFKGAVQGITGDVLVLDIGGGSTEFILGNKDKGIYDMLSLDIGAVRLSEKYKKNDPITQEDLERLEGIIKLELDKISPNFLKVTSVIGIGGTITSISSIKQELQTYDWRKIHHSKLSKKDIANILKKLTALKLEERKKVWGLQPSRADIIVEGNIILKYIVDQLAVSNIIISESDNLEGMLYKWKMEL